MATRGIFCDNLIILIKVKSEFITRHGRGKPLLKVDKLEDI